ncbi:hypothetical protein, partial [Gemmiger formicilis]
APLRRLRHGICVAKMLDNTQSIICAFGLAAAAPRSPYRHLELCGIALCLDAVFGNVYKKQAQDLVKSDETKNRLCKKERISCK